MNLTIVSIYAFDELSQHIFRTNDKESALYLTLCDMEYAPVTVEEYYETNPMGDYSTYFVEFGEIEHFKITQIKIDIGIK